MLRRASVTGLHIRSPAAVAGGSIVVATALGPTGSATPRPRPPLAQHAAAATCGAATFASTAVLLAPAAVPPIHKDARDLITKAASRAKDEANGQMLDLQEMASAGRIVASALSDVVKKTSPGIEAAAANPSSAKIKGKLVTLVASLKAYNTRLVNLQTEAKSIQSEADAVVRLLWGTTAGAAPAATATATATTESGNASAAAAPAAASGGPASSTSSDFDFDVPPLSRKMDELNTGSNNNNNSNNNNDNKSTSATVDAPPAVETVEGDFIREGSDAATNNNNKKSTSATIDEEEVIIEEIGVEPPTHQEKPAATSNNNKNSDKNKETSAATPISTITQELHEAGVAFDDCLDATSLRSRYTSFLDGAFAKPKEIRTPPSTSGQSSNSRYQQPQHQAQQPPTPQRPNNQYGDNSAPTSYSNANNANNNSSSNGLAEDPYPGAVRKMVDPNKTVLEVKMDIAKERGIGDPATIDLWSGKTILIDHKRLYEYPTIQQFPIEVRGKGSAPP